MPDDREYLEAFESCRLAAGQFHHADHVRVAWMMLRESALEDALLRFSRAIRRFADHHGATGLYHQTVTWTYLFVINERMNRLDADHDWASFRDANPDLFEDYREFLGRFYSREVLSSDFARHQYVLPDRVTPHRVASTRPAN